MGHMKEKMFLSIKYNIQHFQWLFFFVFDAFVATYQVILSIYNAKHIVHGKFQVHFYSYSKVGYLYNSDTKLRSQKGSYVYSIKTQYDPYFIFVLTLRLMDQERYEVTTFDVCQSS